MNRSCRSAEASYFESALARVPVYSSGCAQENGQGRLAASRRLEQH